MNVFIFPVRPASTRSRRGAFSLLEVAFALVIFVIGAIALLRIFPGGLSVLEDSGNRRVAAQMSQDLVTSYTSGDLAPTTAEAIYDTGSNSWDQFTSGWNDYPASSTGLRRQAGTIPLNADDLNSAKDSLKHIQGEKQGVNSGNAFNTNNIPDGGVLVYREGTVSGVTIDPSSGQLDFRNAHYITANRSDLDSNSVKADFRTPYLDDPENWPANDGTITLSRPTGTSPVTYTIVWPFRQVNTGSTLIGSINDVTIGTPTSAGTGYSATTTYDGNTIKCDVSVSPSSGANQPNVYFPLTFSASGSADASLRREKYVCKILDSGGDAATDSPSVSLPIRAPLRLRSNCTYYVSSTWNGRTGSSFDQPMLIPASYNQGVTVPPTAQVPSKSVYGYTPDPQLLTPLRFREFLVRSTTANRGKLSSAISIANFNDIEVSPPEVSKLTQVSIDYDVRDWEYMSEEVTQLGTPFLGNVTQINTGTAEGLSQTQFQYDNQYTSATPAPTPIKLNELREIRTRLGNLRGPVEIKGFYNQSSNQLNVSFNPRLVPPGATLPASEQKVYFQLNNSLAKQGRLYLPGTSPYGALSRARVYYRSRDAWAQQVGLTAPHYLPYLSMENMVSTTPLLNLRERWREFYRASDGYIYFHASEAGKIVEVVHGIAGVTNPTIAQTVTDTVEVQPNVLFVNAMPSDVPAGFATQTYTNPNNSSDPRNGLYYLARSRNRIGSTIFDIRRPTGTSGISVRTLWLNNDRYSQEIAQ